MEANGASQLPPDILVWFANDIWKERRGASALVLEGERFFCRPSDGHTDLETDARLLAWASAGLSPHEVSTVRRRDNDALLLDFVDGPRLSDVFLDLEKLFREGNSASHSYATFLKGELFDHIERFQRIPPNCKVQLIRYPVEEKFVRACRFLSRIRRGIDLSKAETAGLRAVSALYEKHSDVPFRDLNPNNTLMPIVNWSALRKMVFSKNAPNRFEFEPVARSIVHVDFSSARYLVPAQDDFMTLRYHRTTFWTTGIPVEDALRAAGYSDIELCTIVVRFLRLAGRKAAYKLIHPRGYMRRYQHDTEASYFRVLIAAAALLEASRPFSPQGTQSLTRLFRALDTTNMRVPATDAFLQRPTSES
jgi:hypothetical protein